MKRIFLLLTVLVVSTLLLLYSGAMVGGTLLPEIKGDRYDWKMGIALYSFNRHPVEKSVEMARACKVKYVEGFSFYQLGPGFNNNTMEHLDAAGISRLKMLMEQQGIIMTSMYADGKDEKEWQRMFEIAAALHLKFITCEPRREHWDMLDRLAGRYKIKIAIHEHAKGTSPYWHPDSVLAAIKEHKNFGACADLGHWVRSGLDPAECLNKLKGHILGIHLKDVDEKGNTKAQDVVPGTGVTDFAAVVKELKRQKFAGYVYVECEHNWENNVPDVKAAIEHFNKVSNNDK